MAFNNSAAESSAANPANSQELHQSSLNSSCFENPTDGAFDVCSGVNESSLSSENEDMALSDKASMLVESLPEDDNADDFAPQTKKMKVCGAISSGSVGGKSMSSSKGKVANPLQHIFLDDSENDFAPPPQPKKNISGSHVGGKRTLSSRASTSSKASPKAPSKKRKVSPKAVAGPSKAGPGKKGKSSFSSAILRKFPNNSGIKVNPSRDGDIAEWYAERRTAQQERKSATNVLRVDIIKLTSARTTVDKGDIAAVDEGGNGVGVAGDAPDVAGAYKIDVSESIVTISDDEGDATATSAKDAVVDVGDNNGGDVCVVGATVTATPPPDDEGITIIVFADATPQPPQQPSPVPEAEVAASLPSPAAEAEVATPSPLMGVVLSSSPPSSPTAGGAASPPQAEGEDADSTPPTSSAAAEESLPESSSIYSIPPGPSAPVALISKYDGELRRWLAVMSDRKTRELNENAKVEAQLTEIEAQLAEILAQAAELRRISAMQKESIAKIDAEVSRYGGTGANPVLLGKEPPF